MKKIFKTLKVAVVAVVIVVIAVIALLCWLFFGVLMPFYNVPNDNKAVAAYNPEMNLVSQETYDALMASDKAEKFELGINEAGEVVFVHPYKAFGRAKNEYKAVWKYADKDMDKKHLSRTYYIEYIDFLSDVAAANPDMADDARIYAEILEIYSHSYNKHR